MKFNYRMLQKISICFVFVFSSIGLFAQTEGKCIKTLSDINRNNSIPEKESTFSGYVKCVDVIEKSLKEIKTNEGKLAKLNKDLAAENKAFDKLKKIKEKSDSETSDFEKSEEKISKMKKDIAKLKARIKSIKGKNISTLGKSYALLIKHYEAEDKIDKADDISDKEDKLKDYL